jgi:hypothetical protein
MVDTVCRVFESRSRAEAALAALHEAGITDAEILGATVTDEPTREAYVAALARAGVGPAASAIYADRLVAGASMVVARPLFGRAGRAETLLRQHNPITLDLPDETPAAAARHDPTPFSTWLGWPTLSRKPLPFAAATGWASLTAPGRLFTEKLFGGLLSATATPLSSRVGWRVLLDAATPFSSRFGWRVLSGQATPFSSRLGWGLLSSNPTPLSSRLGWSLLTAEPTPLSSRFGWRLLIDEPEPFAKWVGWRPPATR